MSTSNTTVHTGFWINHSNSALLGSTLTLSTRSGSILIAALAIFIQVSLLYLLCQPLTYLILSHNYEIYFLYLLIFHHAQLISFSAHWKAIMGHH